MTPVRFQAYSGFGAEVTVIAERVTHWHLIDYNGNYGTAIHLDTGKEVRVTAYPEEVEKKLTGNKA